MKRFDKGYFYYSLVYSLFVALIAVYPFVNLWLDEGSIPPGALWHMVGAYGGVYLFLVIRAALFLRASGYELTAQEIRCRTGVLHRKTSVLRYEKIHAVNKKQNLLHRLFGIAVLTLDSGATANAFQAEITVYEKTAAVDALMERIKALQEGRSPEKTWEKAEKGENLYRFSSKGQLIYSAITTLGAVVTLVVLLALALALVALGSGVLGSAVTWDWKQLLAGVLFLGLVLTALSAVVSALGGVVTSFVAYHDFTVRRDGQDLVISYGLLSKQTNTFKESRIKAVKIHQGPVKALFGYVSAGLEVVGYGNSESSSDSQQQNAAPGMLLPLCRAKELPQVLGRILPDYVPDPVTYRARSYWAFFLWPAAWVSLGFGAAMAAVPGVWAGAAALAWALALAAVAVRAALARHRAGLAIGEDKLTVQNGSLIGHCTVIRRKDLIAIEPITTPCRAKRGICSYKIHFFANAMTNTVLVENLDAGLEKQLEKLLRF